METQVLIIGGGVTGTGLLRDLALRGVDCLLAEKADINAGASGGNHGLLHSGARYAAADQSAARECVREREILKRIAPQCIEETGGIFAAAAGDDENYLADFPEFCRRSGLWIRELDISEARDMEPALSPDLIGAYEVRDGVIDPFMLSLDNLAQARLLGGRVRRNWLAEAMDVADGQIKTVRFKDLTNGRQVEVRAEVVINAAGAWAGLVANLAGVSLPMVYSKGTLLVTQSRLTRRVINRLRPPADADILAPGGSVSILGTTSLRVDSPDGVRPTVAEVDCIINDARAMLPVLERTRYIRAYSGVRPLVASGRGQDDRKVSRDFTLADHARDEVDNFITIAGGKLTTFRLMAEKAADLACRKLDIHAPCLTRTEPLPPSTTGRWTEPGLAPRTWMEHKKPNDMILCECELTPSSVVDQVLGELDGMSGRSLLKAVNLRSRVGKGPCQGGMCGPRISAYLYERDRLHQRQGLDQLKAFVERRWRGFRPVQWGDALEQAELQEALYCGFMGLDLTGNEAGGGDEPGG